MNFPLLDPHLKMLAHPRTLHSLKLAAIALSLFLTLYILFAGHANVDASQSSYTDIYKSAVSGKKAVFVDKFVDTEVDGPFDNSTLVALCKNTRWTPGLIFQCESPEGGIGNVRNIVLNCVRYAIEAGATGLVIPEILIQTSKSATSSPVPFTHFFDTAHFTSTLTSTCPRIHVYAHVNDLYDLPSTAAPVPLTASSLTKSFVADTVLAVPGNWSASFRHFLNESHPTPFTAAKPVLVTLKKALLQFPLSYDDPRLVATFPRMLRFRADTKRLAGTILYALTQKYDLALQPQNMVQVNKFYGAHLRTGPDATAAGWTPYETQSANYLFSASHLNLPVVYLVSGNPNDIYAFSEMAANMSIHVAHKELLLGGANGKGAKGFEKEWRDLKTLSWDQRLLVDYEVLLRASSFGGTWESSLSWNVAMRRHVVVGKGRWVGLEGQVAKPVQAEVGDAILPATAKGLPGAKKPASQEEEEEEEEELDPLTLMPIVKGPGGVKPVRRRMLDVDVEKRTQQGSLNGRATINLESSDALEVETRQTHKKPGKIFTTQVGDISFRDALSVVFGPVGEGKRIKLSMWP